MTKRAGRRSPSPTHSKPKPFRPAPPSFRSKRVATTHSSIRFTLKLANAVRIAYKVDVPDGTAEMTVVEKPQQSTFLVGSLQAETDYVLTVVAYNGKDEPSEPATHSFTTPAYTAFAFGSTPWRPHTESISRPTWTPANSRSIS